jgi:hypothetical protein
MDFKKMNFKGILRISKAKNLIDEYAYVSLPLGNKPRMPQPNISHIPINREISGLKNKKMGNYQVLP